MESSGFCIECGQPHASICAYEEGGVSKWVHSTCYPKYAQRLLRGLEGVNHEDRERYPGRSGDHCSVLG